MLDDGSFSEIYRQLVKAARHNFTAFLHVVFPQSPGCAYVIGELHEFLANLVQQVFDGEAKPRQAVSVPPQHGKSRMLAVRAAAWLIGRQPGVAIALTSFSGDLLKKFLREVKDVMETPEYKMIFPGIEPIFGRDTATEIDFNNGSTIIAKSCGSKLTGRKVDWLIVDDPHAGRAEAESPTLRKRVIDWYFADCMTRLSDGAKVFLIMTRWHPADLVGHLTDSEYSKGLAETPEGEREMFNVVSIPAICEDSNDPLGRCIGDPLFPEQRPLAFLLGLKAGIPPYEWDSQYRGKPRAASSYQIDSDLIHRITKDELPEDMEFLRGWDLALGEKKTNDKSAGALCAYHKETDMFYIVHVWKDRKVWNSLKPIIKSLAEDDASETCTRMAVEAVAGFGVAYDELKEMLKGLLMVEKRNPPKGGKLLRAQQWFVKIQAGKVSMVRGSWNKDFIDELDQFPLGKHDDQIDAISTAFEALVKRHTVILV